MDMYMLKFPYRRVLLPAAKKMLWMDPDALGYIATGATFICMLCYIFSQAHPWMLLAAIGLTLFRMTLNTIDGVIAIEQKKDTLVGEIVNALPDRYSDIFLMAGIAFSSYCAPVYAFAGLASMFLVSYTGMLGKAVGVEWQHHGPLGKVERLIIIMIFTLWQYLGLLNGHTGLNIAGMTFTPFELCMLLFVVLGQLAVYNRLNGMLKQINKLEWEKKNMAAKTGKKVLVVYDSATGNTRKVAEAIAAPLNAELRAVDEAGDPSGYDAIVLGTPNIRKNPTPKMQAYIKANASGIKKYAFFTTWGMPVWGPLSKSGCSFFAEKFTGKKPLAAFDCRGRHAKYKTYGSHPDALDLLDAYNFGTKIARKIKKDGE